MNFSNWPGSVNRRIDPIRNKWRASLPANDRASQCVPPVVASLSANAIFLANALRRLSHSAVDRSRLLDSQGTLALKCGGSAQVRFCRFFRGIPTSRSKGGVLSSSNAFRQRSVATVLAVAALATIVWAGWIAVAGMFRSDAPAVSATNKGETPARASKTDVESDASPTPAAVGGQLDQIPRPVASCSTFSTVNPSVSTVNPSVSTADSSLSTANPAQGVDQPGPLNPPSNGGCTRLFPAEAPVNLPAAMLAASMSSADAIAESLSWTVRSASGAAWGDRKQATGTQPTGGIASKLVDGSGVVIRNPITNGGAVRYMVDRNIYTLKPGELQRLDPGELGVVRYHRGGEFGDARLVLSPGVYEFAVSARGWELSRATSAGAPPSR